MSCTPFSLVLLTAPEPHPAEPEVLACLLESPGRVRLHLRRPGWSEPDTAAWLRQLPAAWLPRVVLHAHHALAREFAVGGCHWPAAARVASSRLSLLPGTASTSLHSLEEVRGIAASYDYAFLSPVFDSISKAGYSAAFPWPELTAALRARPEAQILALGGVTAAFLPAVRAAGFAGAAVLGAVWEAAQPVAAVRELLRVAATL